VAARREDERGRHGFVPSPRPASVFRAGAVVADHVSPVTEEQVQPNGVDLTLDGVERFVEPGRIGRDDKQLGAREPLAATDGDYRLGPGGYAATYAERVAVPEGHVGFVLPRSSLMRSGATIDTAVWDAGYEGRGEGLLQVHSEVHVERGARVAQFVLARAGHEETYDGSYQGERLEEDGASGA
jgi:dUTP pyrophosphatase